MRHLAVLAVAGDEVGDVVADHPAEPPALVALVGEVTSDISRGGDADFDILRVAACFCCGVVDVTHGPIQDHGIRKLQDEAVGLAPDGAERLGTVARHPHVEVAVFDPRYANLRATEIHLPAFGELLDDVHRFLDLGELGRFSAEDALGRVATADAADGAVAEHIVEGGEGRGRYRWVTGSGVRHAGADHYPLCRGEHLGVDDVGLLPEDVRVEGPGVGEAESLGPLGQLDYAPGWRVGLQGYAEVHTRSFSTPACATTRGTRCSVHLRPASRARRRQSRPGFRWVASRNSRPSGRCLLPPTP